MVHGVASNAETAKLSLGRKAEAFINARRPVERLEQRDEGVVGILDSGRGPKASNRFLKTANQRRQPHRPRTLQPNGGDFGWALMNDARDVVDAKRASGRTGCRRSGRTRPRPRAVSGSPTS